MTNTAQDSRQTIIIHLSDIHFGANHRFYPPPTVEGDRPTDESYPSLLDKLKEDLNRPDPGCPVLICITGDLVETGSLEEFKAAEKFIDGLAVMPIFGKPRGVDSILVVPGNHDIDYTKSETGDRWQQWVDFHNRKFKTNAQREDPLFLARVRNLSESHNIFVACLNTSIFVEKGTKDAQRGRMGDGQLEKLQDELASISTEELDSSIRLAIMHHHPVLIPALAEKGRGYDAIHESGQLLNLLHRFGFHLILHGHKHHPHTFTEDALSAFQTANQTAILIAAGGSLGSTELPHALTSYNCYNIVTVKWYAKAKQARVLVHTRGLVMYDAEGREMLPGKWFWKTLRSDDRYLSSANQYPSPSKTVVRDFDSPLDEENERARIASYKEVKGNLPVVHIRPSLTPGQAYEALLWIVQHPLPSGEPHGEEDLPVAVTWSAGQRFEVITVQRKDDPSFCASLDYYGPMLVQARLEFANETSVFVYVYAHLPSAYDPLETDSLYENAN